MNDLKRNALKHLISDLCQSTIEYAELLQKLIDAENLIREGKYTHVNMKILYKSNLNVSAKVTEQLDRNKNDYIFILGNQQARAFNVARTIIGTVPCDDEQLELEKSLIAELHSNSMILRQLDKLLSRLQPYLRDKYNE